MSRFSLKSVARWTHKHFSPAAFSAWQATQGVKGGKAGTAENEAKAGSLGGLSGSIEDKVKDPTIMISEGGLAKVIQIPVLGCHPSHKFKKKDPRKPILSRSRALEFKHDIGVPLKRPQKHQVAFLLLSDAV